MRRGWVWEGKERKTSFLKKRSKRLLSMASNTESKWMELGVTRNRKKFFGSFFQKRTAFFPLTSSNAEPPSMRITYRPIRARLVVLTSDAARSVPCR
ncbi:MAG TPA: hypothetical protein VMB71_06530, partial [Acetobacteraceae bacterium]|nr:hypothetical protein [Acetobacteraceae bacterium]